uniref:Uncharacterized protein n=1 Tax=Amphilophus citrinellus TaxID=61819 RepID=A0A3Q0RQJ9_AMPCI
MRTDMADMDTQTTHTEPVVDEEAPLFSNMDLLLFSIIVGFFIYWFMSRKKPEPIPEFKKLDTPYVFISSFAKKLISWTHIYFDTQMICVAG